MSGNSEEDFPHNGQADGFFVGKNYLLPPRKRLSCGLSISCKSILWLTWLAQSNEKIKRYRFEERSTLVDNL